MERVWGVSCVLYEVFGYVSRSLEFVGACPQKLGRLGVGARERIDALLKRILRTSLYYCEFIDAIRYKGIRVSVRIKQANATAKQPNSVESPGSSQPPTNAQNQQAERKHTGFSLPVVCVYSPGVPNHPPVLRVNACSNSSRVLRRMHKRGKLVVITSSKHTHTFLLRPPILPYDRGEIHLARCFAATVTTLAVLHLHRPPSVHSSPSDGHESSKHPILLILKQFEIPISPRRWRWLRSSLQ